MIRKHWPHFCPPPESGKKSKRFYEEGRTISQSLKRHMRGKEKIVELSRMMNATWEWLMDVYLRNKEIGNIKLLVRLLGNVIWVDLSVLSHGRPNSGLIRQFQKRRLVGIKIIDYKKLTADYKQWDKIKIRKYSKIHERLIKWSRNIYFMK